MSPKFHSQLVGSFSERSVKITLRGAVPVLGSPMNFATGVITDGWAWMNSGFVTSSEPAILLQFRVTL